MSVLIETSLGNLVVDLFTDVAPQASLNFLKLCKVKYYNFCLFHNVQRGFTAQSGDPTGTGKGGQSVFGLLHGPKRALFPLEIHPTLKHDRRGLMVMAALGGGGTDQEGNQLVNGSQFFFTLGDQLDYLDGKYTIFGELAEGEETLDAIESAFVDEKGRPLQDIRWVLADVDWLLLLTRFAARIKHTIVLDDPFPDPVGLQVPDRSPVPSKEMLEVCALILQRRGPYWFSFSLPLADTHPLSLSHSLSLSRTPTDT